MLPKSIVLKTALKAICVLVLGVLLWAGTVYAYFLLQAIHRFHDGPLIGGIAYLLWAIVAAALYLIPAVYILKPAITIPYRRTVGVLFFFEILALLFFMLTPHSTWYWIQTLPLR